MLSTRDGKRARTVANFCFVRAERWHFVRVVALQLLGVDALTGIVELCSLN